MATCGFGLQLVQAVDAGHFAWLSANGRGGLGTIVVKAAGNETLNANGDGVNASRHTITVAATEDTGFVADYSNFGACILVTAPAASVTTDLMGTGGDNTAASQISGTACTINTTACSKTRPSDASPGKTASVNTKFSTR